MGGNVRKVIDGRRGRRVTMTGPAASGGPARLLGVGGEPHA